MSLSSPSVPTVPNPQVTAQQQQGINQQTLEADQSANQINQVTPTGSLTYTQTGTGPNGVPTYTATQTLSPAEQELLTQMQGTQSILGSQAGSLLSQANYGGGTNPFTSNGTTANGGTPSGSLVSPLSPGMMMNNGAALPSSAGSPAAGASVSSPASTPSSSSGGGTALTPAQIVGNSTSGETQALLNQETSYLNPQFQLQTSQLDTQLRSQGINPGSPAYTQAMQNLQLNQNQAVTGFLASAEPAAYQQATASYELPLTIAEQEFGMASPAGVGTTTTPQYSMNPANLEGDVATADQANMAAYNAQVAQQNAMMSGLFGLGGAAISGGTGGFGNSLAGSLIGGTGPFSGSDRRIKQNVVQVGSLFDGTPVYRYQIIGEERFQIGLMAQDVEQFAPDAVREFDGIKHVDYRKATERAVSHG